MKDKLAVSSLQKDLKWVFPLSSSVRFHIQFDLLNCTIQTIKGIWQGYSKESRKQSPSVFTTRV